MRPCVTFGVGAGVHLGRIQVVLVQDTAFQRGSRGRLAATERDGLLNIFISHCSWTRVYCLWRPNLPDEGDNQLIELAVAGGARHVVTKNLRDEKHRRLKALAQSRGTPINRLLEEMTTLMLAEFDAETRFNVRAARGAARDERGLELLQKAQHTQA